MEYISRFESPFDMFEKKHFRFIQNFESHFFYNSCIVKYSLFEDDPSDKKERSDLYEKMSNGKKPADHFLMKIIKKSLSKNEITPIYFVIRVIEKKNIAQNNKTCLLHDEYRVRKNIRHPFLVNFIDSFQDKKNLFYITEFSSGGFFFFYLWKRNFLTKYEAMFYIAEIILCLQYLHSKNLLYRALFPSNILITTSGHIKLKFDLLNKQGVNENELNDNIRYIPYDYFKDGKLGPESDFWSVGTILYEMLTGQCPFADADRDQIRYNIMCKKIITPVSFDVHTIDLLYILLDRNRMKRRNICVKHPDYIRAHPFFEDLDWEALEQRRLPAPMKFDMPLPEPEQLCMFSEIFTADYRENETDGYHHTFKYYQGGQFNKLRHW